MSRNYDLMRKVVDTPRAIQDRKRNPVFGMPRLLRAPEDGITRGNRGDDSTFEMPALLRTLVRRRMWIFACTAALVLAGALVCLVMTPQYRAESKVEILKQDLGGVSLGDAAPSSAVSSDALDFNLTLQTQLAVLKSDALAWQVIKELKLADPSKIPSVPVPAPDTTQAAAAPSGPVPDKQTAAILRSFKRHLTVDAISGTRLITVGYLHPDPKMAAKIVNQLVSDFIEYNFQVRYNATTKATEWLGHQLVDLKAQVEQSQARAVQLEKESGIFGEDEHHNIVLTRLEQLNNEVTAAEADRVLAESVYKLSRSGNPELVTGILGSQNQQSSGAANTVAVLNNLRQQEATLNAQYADSASKYGPAYPRLIELKERLNSVRASIAAELRKLSGRAKNRYEVAATREAAAKKAFTEQKAAAAEMNDKATNYLIAKHEADSSRALYEHLLQKVKEAGVLAGLHSSELQVVDPAQVPARPARPNVPLYLAIAALSGMVLGLVCAFVAEGMDDSIRDIEEIEARNVPVVGVIPNADLLPSNGHRLKGTSRDGLNGAGHNPLLLSLQNPMVAEAFRAVRTSLLLSRPDEPSKVFMITSAVPQEGKSFASLNLAAALAFNSSNVLLVDADLRRGTLSRLLGQQSEIGLSEILSEETSPEAAYRKVDLAGLTFLPAGKTPRGPAELLESERMSAIIRKWRQQFAFVVIDTPPVLPVTDAVVLSPKVDAVVVVTRFAVTNRQSMIRTIRLLRDVQAARTAVLVNAMDIRSPEYYHYAGPYGYDDAQSDGGSGEPQLLVPPTAGKS